MPCSQKINVSVPVFPKTPGRGSVVVAATLWGHRWATKHVEFRLGNMAVVRVLHSSTSKDPNMMILLCYFSLIAAHNSLAFTASYTPGRDNSIADSLSHFDSQCFDHLASHAANIAMPILLLLLAQLLVIWLESANSTWLMVLLLQPVKFLTQLNASS